MTEPMSSMERVLATLQYEKTDRLPFFLLMTYHGAKELGLSQKAYFSDSENVAQGQLILREKYQQDCLNPFYYAAAEVEAFGSKTLFFDDSPPNAGAPIIRTEADILKLRPPVIEESPSLVKALKTISLLKHEVGERVPILGAVISPFSLPIMQMGFDRYIELIYERPDLFWKLMRVNENFAIEWGKAQIRAGVSAINFVDPCASSGIFPLKYYKTYGLDLAKRVMAALPVPKSYALGSAKVLESMPLINETGASLAAVGYGESIAQVKAAAEKKMAVFGNFNAMAMSGFSEKQVEDEIKHIIRQGYKDGGFIICDGAGEIPIQVSEKVLKGISEAVLTWGVAPEKWVDDDE